ncbi:sodium/nucleoside cotransporter 1-like [Clavelina lepadiformis]|uniref:sodium/nucleoside cotransporter 1-like n=1 Tax=Clavelina lepadiformis TaxID=159417 RepID=UPI0040422045
MSNEVKLTSFTTKAVESQVEVDSSLNSEKLLDKNQKINPAYEMDSKNSDENGTSPDPVSSEKIEFEDLPDEGSKFLKSVTYPLTALTEFVIQYQRVILIVIGVILACGVTAYMGVACWFNFNRAITLLVIWCLVVGYNVYAFLRDHYGKEIWDCFRPIYKAINDNMYWIKWIFILCVVAGLAVWIALDTSKRPSQLISGAGYFIFLFGIFLTSKHPDRVRWRPVLWGLLIQVCIGMFILRTEAGFAAFNWLGNLVQTFINYVDAGAIFLFGDGFAEHYFAFKVLPIIIYFSAFISVLYYLGVMEWLILKMAWLMQISLGTSATESMAAAGNIFVGMTESPLMIRPYIKKLTPSELNAIMTAGFGTIAGSVLGAYLGFGIQPVFVITACIMAAPCALAVAKLSYPETKVSKFQKTQSLRLEKMGHLNVIDAAADGAALAVPLVLNIGGILIAFISLLAALNGVLSWFGGLLDFPQLSFELMCSYIFLPVTYLMGIDWVDCLKCSELIGVKIFLNEFIAYEDLAAMLTLRDSGTVPKVDPVTGAVNWIDERSEAIITYALCGFANIGSIGLMIGGLAGMAPERRTDMVNTVIRAFFSGVFVSILNACVAGFLYAPRPIFCDNMMATTNWTETDPGRLFQCCSATNLALAAENCCLEYNWTSTEFNLNCTAYNIPY